MCQISFIYANNEPKSALARDLGDCRDNKGKLAKRVFTCYIHKLLYDQTAAITPAQTHPYTADNIFPSALKDRRDHLSRRSFLVQGP